MTDEILSADHQLPRDSVVPDKLVALEVHERQGLSGVSVNLVDCVDDAMKLMSWLGERRPVMAVDTETTGFNAWAGKLRLVQIGDAMTGWAIPWEMWGGVFVEAMTKYQGPITFHNAAFDARWLTVHTPWEVPWARTHDTMIMAHVIDPTQAVGLKPLSNRFVDRRASAGEILLKTAFHDNKWSWDTVPLNFGPYWEYAALDCVLTARLWELFRADQRYPETYELEMDTRRIVSKMEDNGSPIDVEYCQQQYDALSEYVEQMKEWFLENHGVRIGSTGKMAEWFIGLGAKIDRFTPKGNPQLDKIMLNILVEDGFPLAKVLLGVRKAEKLSGTYFKNFLAKHVDGNLHPQIRTLGARTGRMSMTDPALQTLPKGEPTVRNAFIAREGEQLLSVDYDQIEMRLLAHFSGDPGLIGAFNDADSSGGDFFVNLAQGVFNDPSITKEHPLRGRVKGVAYGKAYGAGVAKMAETAGLRYDEMKPSVDLFDRSYPGVLDFQKRVEQAGFERERSEGIPYVLTPFGRRLPADSGRIYTLTNYLLQSHAAEILKRALVHLDNAGMGDNMLLPVHDEIIFSLKPEDMEEAKHIIRGCMEDRKNYRLPLTVGVDGPYDRWGRKYEKKVKPQAAIEAATKEIES